MYMIVKYLPKSMAIDDLVDGLQPLLQSSLFRKTGQIKAVKFIALVNKEKRIIERHALVRLCSEPVRLRLIRAFNKAEIKKQLQFSTEDNSSKGLMASNYTVRSWRNDRRLNANLKPPGENRRQYDRRRPGLSVYPLIEKTF